MYEHVFSFLDTISLEEVITCLNIIIREHQKLKVIHNIGITELRGITFRFKTDTGVFSKSEVDFGSRLLIDAFEMPETRG